LLPLAGDGAALPGEAVVVRAARSPKRRLGDFLAASVPTGKIHMLQALGENPPDAKAGKFMLSQPPTRQNFPPSLAVEIIH
jgi:hypothetical protein